MRELFPNPGVIPTLPPPDSGERVIIRVSGLPPYKDLSFSIRNPSHPNYAAFVELRNEAIKVMGSRTWYDGAIKLNLTLNAPTLDRNLSNYVGGIEDTLDGSHGMTFTYLPIVFQDDCQVCSIEAKFVKTDKTGYIIEIEFV
jgi:hypothetical protein